MRADGMMDAETAKRQAWIGNGIERQDPGTIRTGGRTMGLIGFYDPFMIETVRLMDEERRAAAEVRLRSGEPPFRLSEAWRVRRPRTSKVGVLLAGILRILGLLGH
jgi:hypothetical protein